METYRILYRIKVAHDYFNTGPCNAITLRLTPQGEALARRRGLLFRQTAANEWTLLSCADPAEDEMLTLDLCMTDAHFPLYTEWDGFQPSAAYTLELPKQEADIEVATTISLSGKKRAIGSGICTISLRLTADMAEAAKEGKPMQATIHFRAPSMQWEYLFIPRGEETATALRLEDTTGTVEFSEIEPFAAYGRSCHRTVSKASVPMRQAYGCKLRLVAQDKGKPPRTLLPHVPVPEPGRFYDAEQGNLRQVCYY